MRSQVNPYHLIYYYSSKLSDPDRILQQLTEALENEISLLAKDETQVFHSTHNRLQFLFTSGILDESLFLRLTSLLKSNAANEPLEICRALLSAWISLIQVQTGIEIPEDLKELSQLQSVPEEHPAERELESVSSCRISILKFIPEDQMLSFVFDAGSEDIQYLSLDASKDKIKKQLKHAMQYLSLPFDLYAHNLRRQDSCWTADHCIILPDYLIDVTSIASCISATGTHPLKHLIQLYYFSPAAYSTLVGTTVNQFLDELILNPELNFEKISGNVFQHNPIAISLLKDTEVKLYLETIENHFNNLSKTVKDHFHHRIQRLDECLLEPSFYSVEYGIQGRLDVFYHDQQTQQKFIIELKSGKPFQPNKFNLNADHHAQIVLYYLLIRSVFGHSNKTQCLVLYSSQSDNSLREAPVIDEMQSELIFLRNSIVLLHLHLAFRKPADPFILDMISEKNYESSESYTRRDAGAILSIFQSLSHLEKDYFRELSGFIAREQFISKLGRAGAQYTEGLASLWLLTEQEKIRNYMILPNLKIANLISDKNEYPILVLQQDSDFISNFRTGDTLVLYSGNTVLNEQIYKCTLVEQYPNEYHVRLRTRQFPNFLECKEKVWNLEHDALDRSFNYQFQGLLDFSKAEEEVRQKIMGLFMPAQGSSPAFQSITRIPQLIQPVIHKILQSKDYFLLWGPPGSGKTSMIIKHLINILQTDTTENVLLLAYTNRAVDEICEAIDSLNQIQNTNYIRIGSRFAVAPKFRKYLLEEQTGKLQNRKQLLQLIHQTRIFTATLASIQGKKELFSLKKFDTVIIDEASQILESQLAGLLPRFNRFILIGDHMQLPAVTTQSEGEAAVQSKSLQDAGFQSLSMSLFERLLQQCITREWHHAYEMLEYQGRMHEELMRYPSAVFYADKLKILPSTSSGKQSIEYLKIFPRLKNETAKILATHRTIFIHCENPDLSSYSKTNPVEASCVCHLIRNLHELYFENAKPWTDYTIGVITPFRAQISQIKSALHRAGLDSIPLTIDTAERYQGGTRDIIIVSTVITNEKQLPQISSLTTSGMDRKLNVALTRAKEQIILLGNRNALGESPLYKQLIEYYWNWAGIDFQS